MIGKQWQTIILFQVVWGWFLMFKLLLFCNLPQFVRKVSTNNDLLQDVNGLQISVRKNEITYKGL